MTAGELNTWKCHTKAEEERDRAEIIRLLEKHGCTSEHMNPGGREFGFPFGRVQISDCCNSCDLQKLKDFLHDRSDKRNG